MSDSLQRERLRMIIRAELDETLNRLDTPDIIRNELVDRAIHLQEALDRLVPEEPTP